MIKPSEGYFFAKREARDAMIRRISVLQKELEGPSPITRHDQCILKAKIEVLEEFVSFMRNVMLWDTRRGA